MLQRSRRRLDEEKASEPDLPPRRSLSHGFPAVAGLKTVARLIAIMVLLWCFTLVLSRLLALFVYFLRYSRSILNLFADLEARRHLTLWGVAIQSSKGFNVNLASLISGVNIHRTFPYPLLSRPICQIAAA